MTATTTDDEGRALQALAKAARAHDTAAAKAAATKTTRDRLVLEVREAHDTPYTRLAASLGLTKDRVTQILREQRQQTVHPNN